MFRNHDVSQDSAATPSLYCVWIRANETPGAPLIAVWMDSKMRAFETEECPGASAPADCRSVEEAEAFDS